MSAQHARLVAELANVAADLAKAASRLALIAERLEAEHQKPLPPPVAKAFEGAPAYLTSKEAAQILGVSEGALCRWRCMAGNKGPPSIRIGRLIRYPLADLMSHVGKAK